MRLTDLRMGSEKQRSLCRFQATYTASDFGYLQFVVCWVFQPVVIELGCAEPSINHDWSWAS
jgi:hypothetical protein